MTRLKALFNPRDKTGGYVLPHAVVLILLVAISLFVGFGAGWFARGTTFNAAYYSAHYVAPLKVPAPSARPLPRLPRGVLPLSGGLIRSKIPVTGDQGQTGSCVSQANTRYATSYLRRVAGKGWPTFSPRWTHDLDAPSAEDGSIPDHVIATGNARGWARQAALPYGSAAQSLGLAAYGWENPPQGAIDSAAANRFTVTDIRLWDNPGAGAGGVDLIKQYLSQGIPVTVATSVHPGFDNASFTGGYVEDDPLSNDYDRGGHDIIFVAFSDSMTHTDKTSGVTHHGYFTFKNSWGSDYGHKGYGYMSYDYASSHLYLVRGLSLGATGPQVSAHLTVHPPTKAPSFSSPNKHTFPPPPLPPGAAKHRTHGWYVGPNAPYHKLVNAAGDKYKVWPVGIEAAIGTESNFQATAYRCVSYYDCSCGVLQITLPTAGAYGLIGTPSQVCAWLNVPANEIPLAARLFRDFRIPSCERFSPFGGLYSSYNQGAYLGCGSYLYHFPTNFYAIQALKNWNGWFAYVETKWMPS